MSHLIAEGIFESTRQWFRLWIQSCMTGIRIALEPDSLGRLNSAGISCNMFWSNDHRDSDSTEQKMIN